MDRSKVVRVPQMCWYGDTELELNFPDSWEIITCHMHGHNAPPINQDAIREAFRNPVGTNTIRELARGKKEVAIIFDDMSRPTPVSLLVTFVLEELAAAGIDDDNIRFISAPGTHGCMNGIDFRKKLGDEVMDRFLVYNHNPYENCTPLGTTSRGTPVSINSEFMSCDLKIGIGCIVPHPQAGFGGGPKILLPGIASIDTITVNHARLTVSPTSCIGRYEDNIMEQDIIEAARMAGLDVKIDAIVNLKREIVALYVGDPVDEHVEGIKFARRHYATDFVGDCDIVIANCYSKANEIVLAPILTAPLLTSKGGDMIIITVTPEGQITHYGGRSFGKKFGGRLWHQRAALPENTKRLTIMAPYPNKVGADWIAPYDSVNRVRSWDEVINMLMDEYGDKAKVAVIPDATIQYFPDVLNKEKNIWL